MKVLSCMFSRRLLTAGLLLLITLPLKAQDFSLCSVVDTKRKVITLGWNRPSEPVTGYSFEYNNHEVTPYRPTIDDPDQLSFKEGVGYGKHSFQVSGYKTAFTTNEVRVELKKPRYITALVPGLYQAMYQQRYISSCEEKANLGRRLLGVAEPVVLFAATGIAAQLWVNFFAHRNAAINARDVYEVTLQEEEFNLWRSERAKARDVFPQALTVSVVTLSLNAITAGLLSPRGKARIQGGFSLDCRSHPGSVELCINL